MYSHLLFSKNHIWVDVKDDVATIGITDYAQERLGAVLFVNLPNVDDEITESQTFGDIESVKTVSDLIAPMSGKVVECNEVLFDDPNLINASPFENWLIKVKIGDEVMGLMKKDEYLEYRGINQ